MCRWRLNELSCVAEGSFCGLMMLLGKAYRKQGRFRNACEAFLGAARLNAADWEAFRLAGEVTEVDLKSLTGAKELFAESLRRKPTQPDLIEKLHGREARRQYEVEATKALEAMVKPHVPGIPELPVPGKELPDQIPEKTEKTKDNARGKQGENSNA